MLRGQTDNQADRIVNRAVQKSRTPGTQQRESGAGRVVNTFEDMGTTTDESGNAIHPLMLDLDSTDDPNAQLT